MPDHKTAKELGTSQDWFIFLWWNFHIYNAEDLNVQAEKEAGTSYEDDKEEGTLYDKSMERIMHDKDDSDEEDENEDDNDEDTETKSDNDDETPPKVWYFKLKYLIDHVRDTSMSLIWILETCLALGEMMVKFLGRSMKTYHIKDKPIGDIINFTPDGKTAAKSQQQEYKTVQSVGKIEIMILHI
eukprot:1102833-Ditylum_brightwellii.AAC.1